MNMHTPVVAAIPPHLVALGAVDFRRYQHNGCQVESYFGNVLPSDPVSEWMLEMSHKWAIRDVDACLPKMAKRLHDPYAILLAVGIMYEKMLRHYLDTVWGQPYRLVPNNDIAQAFARRCA